MAQSLDALSRTWSDAGTTFTAIKYDITDTASASGSLLLDLRTNSTSRFSVGKAGSITTPAGTFAQIGGNRISGDGVTRIDIGFTVASNIGLTGQVGFGTAPNTPDTIITRDGAANTLAQRNGANAQAFRLYGTYTAADNFQRLAITSASATLSALSGASVTATGLIPAGAVVMGVTSRVSTLITGADGYQIGTGADADRWADKTGVAVGTTTDNRDWTAGTIENFAAATDVIVTAKTANFTAGAIVVTVHYLAGQAD